jgi:hypothetical protein
LALYTFRKAGSAARVAEQLIVTDTSYLIALSDSTDKSHESAKLFHNQAFNNRARFMRQVYFILVEQAHFLGMI